MVISPPPQDQAVVGWLPSVFAALGRSSPSDFEKSRTVFADPAPFRTRLEE